MLPIKKTVEEIEELLLFVSEKNTESKKQSEIKELLKNLKKFLLNKKVSSSRKADIILRLPLLQITVRKAC